MESRFTKRIHVFHNHLSEHGSKTMGLDGTVAIDSEVGFQKSDFDMIPFETHISIPVAFRYMSRRTARRVLEDCPQNRARKGGKAVS